MTKTGTLPLPKIVVFHMRDDLSGSTRVLSHALKALSRQGFEIDLYSVCIDYPGFLSDLEHVNHIPFPYRRHRLRLRTFLSYVWAQCWLFFAMFKYQSQHVSVYINTVMPFGPALASFFMRKRVVYHMHETSLAPAPSWLKWFLYRTMQLCANEVIHVSQYLKTERQVMGVNNHVIYNSLTKDFLSTAEAYRKLPEPDNKPCILLVCSLAPYKGIGQFCDLARSLPNYRFQLVLNATRAEFEHIYDSESWPANVDVFFNQQNMHLFYQRATVLVNLSLPDEHIETFGMTVLEAMIYGLPVIVPPVGGVTELVDDGQNGYLIDARNTEQLVATLKKLEHDPSLYAQMSTNALKKSKTFDPELFNQSIVSVYSPAGDMMVSD